MRTAYGVYEISDYAFFGRWETDHLYPIKNKALLNLDSESVINIEANTIINHASGSAVDSWYEIHQLHSNPEISLKEPFSKRNPYLLIKKAGSEWEKGGRLEFDYNFRYTLSDGEWKRQTLRSAENFIENTF